MLGLLRHRDARLLLAGQSLSLLGDRAMFLALGVWVKSLTGSSAAAGLVFFAYGLPGLTAPAAGLLVDRVRRRRLMIADRPGSARSRCCRCSPCTDAASCG